ncbi:MAG: sensor histidine kinase [Paenibacillus sp.]|nr:sensor histidine kinase [Paenibacillus sp.]
MIRLIRSSLMYKLIVVITAIISCIMIMMGGFSYVKSSEAIKSDAEKFSSQILKQADLNISRYYKEYMNIFILIGGNQEFIRWMQASPEDKYSLYNTSAIIEKNVVFSYLHYRPEILSVVMYNENGIQQNYLGDWSDPAGKLSSSYRLEDSIDLSQISGGSTMNRIVRVSHSYIDLKNKINPLIVMTFVKKYQFHDRTAYIAVDVSLGPTIEILNEIQLGYGAKSMIVDKQGTIISHPDQTQILQPLPKDILNQVVESSNSGTLYLDQLGEVVFFEEIADSDHSKIVVTLPIENLTKSAAEIRNMTIVLFIVGIVTAFVSILLASTSVARRIRDLRQSMRYTEFGNFNHRVQVIGQDELTDLARAFNRLLERLQGKIEEATEYRILQQEAVLSALQSQINSHFLYNALESINSLSHVRNQPDIAQIAISLSKMLRYTSNYTETYVTLQSELEHLQHYLYIIGVLYGESVSYRLEIDESTIEAPCLKAILQPIVENSIKHGLETVSSVLDIVVKVEREGDALVKITCMDNGGGFPEEKLLELQQDLKGNPLDNQLKKMKRIGLLNVHYRLRMLSEHDRVGLSIQNRSGGGAEVAVTIPLR